MERIVYFLLRAVLAFILGIAGLWWYESNQATWSRESFLFAAFLIASVILLGKCIESIIRKKRQQKPVVGSILD